MGLFSDSDAERAEALLEQAQNDPAPIRNNLEELVELLDSSDAEARHAAANALAELAEAAPTAVAPAVGVLGMRLDDDAVREPGARAIAEVAAEQPSLVEEVAEPLTWCLVAEAGGEAASAKALQRLGRAAPEALEPAAGTLGRGLASDTDYVRGVASALLARLAKAKTGAIKPAFESLVNGLTNPDETVRQHAAVAIARVAIEYPDAARGAVDPLVECVREERGGEERATEALRALASEHPDALRPAADRLAATLDSGDPTIRKHMTPVFQTLAAEEPDAVEGTLDRLIARLSDDEAKTREAAANAIAHLAADRPEAIADAVGPLVECVREERGGEERATEALRALASEHPDALRPAADRLAATLDSGDPTIRKHMTPVFQTLAAEEPDAVEGTLDRLIARLSDDEAKTREAAANAIAHLAMDRPEAITDAVGPLARRLSDDRAVHGPAIAALSRLAGADGDAVRPAVPEIEPLLASDDTDVRRHAVGALLNIAQADERAVRPVLSSLEPLLQDEEVRCRAFALGVYDFLTQEAPELAVPVTEAVAASLDREHDRTRRLATIILNRVSMTDAGAVRPAFTALLDRFNDEQAVVREHAAVAVSRIANDHPATAQAEVTTLAACLDRNDPKVRRSAARALRYAAMDDGDWIDSEVVSSMAPLLDDDETEVRGEAAMAMSVFAVEAPSLVPDRQIRRLPGLLRTAADMNDEVITESVTRLQEATGLDLDAAAADARGVDTAASDTVTAPGDAADEPSDRSVAVEQAGVVVEKAVDAESFSRPAVRLLVANRSGEAAHVRVVDTPPAGVSLSTVQFHPDYHANGWTVNEDHGLMEFEHHLGSGRTVETVYSASDGVDTSQAELEPPTVTVAAASDTDAAGTTEDASPSGEASGGYVPPQPPAPTTDIEGVAPSPQRDLTDVAGMTDVKRRLQEEVLVPLIDDRYEQYGFSGVTNILLHGPPGTGKTYLAEALAGHLGYNYVAATASDIASDVVGQAPSNVAALFERARAAAPSVLFIDEIDSVAADRSGTGGMTTSEQQMVTQLLTEIEELNDADEPVLLVAATNRIEDVDDAIERPGRFDARIAVRKPDGEDRLSILRYHLEDVPTEWNGIDEEALVTATEGFTASHLAEVADAAGRTAVRETAEGEEPTVTERHLHDAIGDLQDQRKAETTERQFLRDPPEIDFDDVVGLEEVKSNLQEKVIDPLENPEMFRELNLSIDRGVLLHGPPGTGKTHLARALAGELGINYVQASAADLVSKYIGEGAKNVRSMFEEARTHQPCLVFVDELDALATDRSADQTRSERQMVNEFLDALSDIENADDDVIVVGATNRPDDIDPAIKRSGRLNERIKVPPPDRSTRVALFREYLHTDAAAIDEEWLGRETAGLVASDMERLATEATRAALNRHRADAGGLSEVDVEEVRVGREDITAVLDDLQDERNRGSDDRRADTGDG